MKAALPHASEILMNIKCHFKVGLKFKTLRICVKIHCIMRTISLYQIYLFKYLFQKCVLVYKVAFNSKKPKVFPKQRLPSYWFFIFSFFLIFAEINILMSWVKMMVALAWQIFKRKTLIHEIILRLSTIKRYIFLVEKRKLNSCQCQETKRCFTC